MTPNSRENPRRPDFACFCADLLWAARRTRAVLRVEFHHPVGSTRTLSPWPSSRPADADVRGMMGTERAGQRIRLLARQILLPNLL